MKTFSVIVLLYNCDEQSLKTTIDSILCQKNCDFEIILADDASKNDCLKVAENYLKENAFNSYKIMAHPENVGTVKNIYDALGMAEGKYVKCIGAGDLLFSENTLSEMTGFMDKESCALAYGKMQAYNYQDGKLNFSILTVPQDLPPHEKGNTKKITKNIITNHGWISGASMFFVTEKFKQYLVEMVGTVRYCEDWVQVILLLHNEKLSFYPHGVVYYEVGSGISTNGSNGNSDRIKNDHHNFWNMMVDKYDNKMVKKGKLMYEITYLPSFIKKLFVLIFRNPSYLFMCLRTKFQTNKYIIKEEGMLK